eukprot:m51a1_g2021 hypothetical protein (225) ;mRNA; r:1288692-1289504
MKRSPEPQGSPPAGVATPEAKRPRGSAPASSAELGSHSVSDNFAAKLSDIALCGHTLWVCMSRQVTLEATRAACEASQQQQQQGCSSVWCVFVEPASRGGARDTATSTRASLVSDDGGATWRGLPEGLSGVTGRLSPKGTSIAFVFDRIDVVPENEEVVVDLWDYETYPPPGEGGPLPLRLSLGASTVVARRCDTSAAALRIRSHVRRVVAAARLCAPFCVNIK